MVSIISPYFSVAQSDDMILRKRDFVDAIALNTGVRKGEVHLVLNTLLDQMHEALLQNAEIHLPPLGRVKPITRETDFGPRTFYKLCLAKK